MLTRRGGIVCCRSVSRGHRNWQLSEGLQPSALPEPRADRGRLCPELLYVGEAIGMDARLEFAPLVLFSMFNRVVRGCARENR